jgi:hypothetical protein
MAQVTRLIGHIENHSDFPVVLSQLVGIGRVSRAPGGSAILLQRAPGGAYAVHHATDAVCLFASVRQHSPCLTCTC